MTIKRRLFISNILMIVIPILLSLVCSIIFIGIAVQLLGIEEFGYDENDYIFDQAVECVQSLADNGPFMSLEEVIEQVQTLGLQDQEEVSLAIYKQKDSIYSIGGTVSGPVAENVLLQQASGDYYSYDSITYAQEFGDYTIYISNIESRNNGPWHPGDGPQNGGSFVYGVFVYAGLILIIFITNRLLTKLVFKSVMTPLHTLVDGVHEIRDGNLDYRIEYDGNDEFLPACEDFNEMAEQLSALLRGKQKDDENRRELIAGISHDLRTPLTSIKACAEGLSAGVASTPEHRKEYLDAIINKTDDLAHIVRQLFLFSKLDTGEFPFSFETVDIGRELSLFITGNNSEYRQKGLEIEFEEQAADTFVRIDVVQFRSVLTNVLGNTVRYGDKPQLKTVICSKVDNGNVVISLTDNGPGVPEASIDKLFQVFYRNDKARTDSSKGSGLGLAISARIIGSFGGSICARNHIGGGLAVIITLPTVSGGDDEKDTDY